MYYRKETLKYCNCIERDFFRYYNGMIDELEVWYADLSHLLKFGQIPPGLFALNICVQTSH